MLSVIIPLYNEAENIEPLCQELALMLGLAKISYEVVIVNDGSTDSSIAVINKICSTNPCVKVISLAQNNGQGFAIKTGIEAATMPYITMLDADGQNNPYDILPMFKLLEEYEMVLGYRANRADTFSKTLSSKAGNLLINLLFSVNVKDAGCSLRIGKAEYFKQLNYFPNYHRYFNLLFQKQKIKLIQHPTNHRPRQNGKSKYTFFKFVKVVRELYQLKINRLPLNSLYKQNRY